MHMSVAFRRLLGDGTDGTRGIVGSWDDGMEGWMDVSMYAMYVCMFVCNYLNSITFTFGFPVCVIGLRCVMYMGRGSGE